MHDGDSATYGDDREQIRRLIDDWVIWRDSGDWDRFLTLWHPEGRMMATWFQGTAAEFAEISRSGFERGVRILHVLGGTSADVAGDRAIAQTRMAIHQRADVDGVACDVVCNGRFYDFLERRESRWGWSSASRSTRRTASTRSIRLPTSSSTATCSSGSPRATGTSPTSRPASATTSSRTCPASPGPSSTRCYRRGARWLAGGEI